MQYTRENLRKLLLTIDEEASLALEHECRYPVVIVGGSAFLLHDLTNRPTTHDIDVLSCHEAVRGVLANYRMVNSAVSEYLDEIPYNFEDRLVRIDIPTRTVDFLTPSLEDLAVIKLYGWRPNDQQDLESPAVLKSLDWDLMDRLVHATDKAAASALSPRRYAEMAAVDDEYAARHGHVPHV